MDVDVVHERPLEGEKGGRGGRIDAGVTAYGVKREAIFVVVVVVVELFVFVFVVVVR